jgi:hypothetical protein
MQEAEANKPPSSKFRKVVLISLFGLLALLAGAYLLISNRLGDSGPQSPSFETVRLKAAAGDPASLHALGEFFEEGVNIPRSYDEALRNYSLASEAGNLTARYDYARLLASDKAGAKKDLEKAYKLLLDLANRGNESAQFGMAYFYRYKKRDVTGGANFVEAYAWANVVLAGRGERSPNESISFFDDNSSVQSWHFDSIRHFRNELEYEMPKESLALAQSRSAEIFKAITEARQKK